MGWERGEFEIDICKRADYNNNRADSFQKRADIKGRNGVI
jgi:hypothetical protein